MVNNSMNGAQITGGISLTRKREANDYYATPPEATKAILSHVSLNGSILEPACGAGHISKELEAYYPNSEIVSTDLIDRGFGTGGIDFLTHDYGRKFDNVITNPPFKIIKPFIEKALDVTNDKVVIFAKLQLLESKSRYELFKTTPLKYVYVHVDRVSPYRGGEPLDEKGKPWSSTMAFAWFVWQHGYEGEPVVRFLKL